MKEHWQDDHIKKHDGEYICYDEAGLYLTTAHSIEEAREQIEYYSLYVLNNITD